MLEKAKRTLAGVFSGADWAAASDDSARRDDIANRSDDVAPADILDLLREQGVPTSFFLCGTRAEPSPSGDLMTGDGQAIYAHGFDPARMDRVAPEPFFAKPGRTEDLLTRLRPMPAPCFVRLPYEGGHRTLRVHRLLRDRLSDCLLVHWATSPDDFPIDGCESEQDLVARCRDAVERAFARGRITGTVILLHEDPAEIDAPLSAQAAPLLLREVLRGAHEPHWAVVGIGAPLPV
jgi:peptidoglycan/xylan/chitin deacetylase (PgdA/CDA1 family)